MRPVSIIIPVIRPEGFERCVKALTKAARPIKYEMVSEFDHDKIGAPKMVKMLVERTRYDLVCFLGDDTEPQKDFLVNALWHMGKFDAGWGLVGFNDGRGDELPTHWLADKRLLDHIGGEFFHTGYRHCFCDNELHVRAMALKRYRYAEEARIIHHHPLLKGEKLEGDYARVYAPKNYIHDKMLFYRRNKQWLERLQSHTTNQTAP